jgi:hypothetical protein
VRFAALKHGHLGFYPQDHVCWDYALQQERAKGEEIVGVRFLPCGDVRAYCESGHTYLIAPTAVLLKAARSQTLGSVLKVR